MNTKKCTSCLNEKSLNEFYTRKDRNSYVAACKSCTIKNNYRYRDKEHQKAYKADYHKKNLDRKLRNDLKKYGLTIDQYNEMLEKQNHSCAICFTATNYGKRMYVDHCHKTKIVRGLLCKRCNFLLGLADDSIKILKSSICYLGQHEEKT